MWLVALNYLMYEREITRYFEFKSQVFKKKYGYLNMYTSEMVV